MKNKILQTIREHNLLGKGMHIVIGLSGGPDSLCMFDLFCRMAEEWQLKLYPVHVNHKFRPGAAEEDQDFVEKFCQERGWPCRSFVYDCNAIAEAENLTSEEAGRKVRYASFGKVAGEIAESGVSRKDIAIAVGQNADDQAETILFRLLRGTGVDGLSGIAYKRFDGDRIAVIRPLLDCSRSEIETYCLDRGLSPRRDYTNEEPVYMRNRIRLELLPLLREKYNPNMTATLNRLGAAATQDSEYIRGQAETAYENAVLPEHGSGEMLLSIEVLTSLHQAIRIRVYHKALGQIGLEENLSASHLDGIERVLQSDSPSASWNLPEGYVAEKRYEMLSFRKIVSKNVETARLTVRTLNASTIDDAFNPSDASGSDDAHRSITARFRLNALKAVYGEDVAGKIVLRSRQDGDYMTIATGGGLHRKKLQDMLVDMKIPKKLRDELQLAAVGSEILWILPAAENGAGFTRLGRKGRFSGAYKVEEGRTEPIIVLEYLFQI